MLAEIIVILCVLILVYPILIYPLLLCLISKFFRHTPKADKEFIPEISLVISAYNEEKYITHALESIVDADYPPEKIFVIVGSDGSDDKTAELSRSFKGKIRNLIVKEFPRSGKNNVLNKLYEYINTDIVFFMDADFRLHKNSLREAVKYFADQKVRGVMSRLNIVQIDENNNNTITGENTYQQLENALKKKETEIWTTVNNFGFYGLRKSVLKPIPNANVCDDMFNVLSVSDGGGRMLFIPESEVDEVREKSIGEEMRRRIRLSAGGLATSFMFKKLLCPFSSWAGFFFVSHKFMRFWFPIALILLAVMTFLIFPENPTLFWGLAVSQLVVYLFALIGYFLDKLQVGIKIFSYPYYFIVLNIGFLLGFFHFLSGRQNSIWERQDTRKS